MSKIVWLASFPKSGNTWVRIFLNNYVADGNEPVSINELDEGLHASSRILFDRLIGVPSSDLLPEEIDRYRPAMYKAWAAEVSQPLFVKIHDAWRKNADGQPLFPADTTLSVLYIVRNPLDIVPSLANHYGESIDTCIAWMQDEKFTLAQPDHRLKPQLHQLVSDWSGHAQSWLDCSGLPVRVIRYEDMLINPHETFYAIVQTAGLEVDADRLDKAIQFSTFANLKDQELAAGFQERLADSGRFFNRGRFGGWRDQLTMEQAQRMIDVHRPMMHRFDYLDEMDRPVF
ncbi:MAG: sulfotransferase domain-containing protein [Ardenticatenaceae bacterium]|nr:sulfotransferase domain-containing protein [Ardenticatenaceae bacterium]